MTSNILSQLRTVNQIVAVGSVDGVLTTAALLRVIGNPEVEIVFCQAFTVDKLEPATWKPNRTIAFVDLAVNNQKSEMTLDFLVKLDKAGHKMVAIIDEHNRADWAKVYGTFDGLVIEPQSQAEGVFASSGSILLAALGDEADDHTRELLLAAEAGDRMDFSTRFGGVVNQAVKSNMQDDSRRVHLAQRFANYYEPDDKINGWVEEYKLILANHAEILANKQDLADGIVRVDATGKKVDMTTLMATLYKAGARVVVLLGMAFNKAEGKQTLQISFGTQDKSLDLLACVTAAGLKPIGGFAQKANMEPADEAAATAAIRALLTK